MLDVSVVHVLSEPQGAPRRKQGSLVQVSAPERCERLQVQRRPSVGSQCSGGRHLHREWVRGAAWHGAAVPPRREAGSCAAELSSLGLRVEQESRAPTPPRRTCKGQDAMARLLEQGWGQEGAVLGGVVAADTGDLAPIGYWSNKLVYSG